MKLLCAFLLLFSAALAMPQNYCCTYNFSFNFNPSFKTINPPTTNQTPNTPKENTEVSKSNDYMSDDYDEEEMVTVGSIDAYEPQHLNTTPYPSDEINNNNPTQTTRRFPLAPAGTSPLPPRIRITNTGSRIANI